MRLEHLTLSGFSPAFPGVVDVPFGDLPAGVYAVCGDNGAGKTTLLEASGPGPIFRQMPSCAGADPVTYATSRESFLDLTFTFEDLGRFRARLNLDGPKRQTDAVLEQLGPDGTVTPLNNGQRSTFDEAITRLFPSFDVFINSAFTAQGRGDEFVRRKPSQRKDLCVEVLALQHLADKSEKAAEAATLWADARFRLQAQIEMLERDGAPAIGEQLERIADELQAKSGAADVRKRELSTAIAELEARAALLADQVAAYTAATQRVQTLDTELGARRAERTALDRDRQAAGRTLAEERLRITVKRDGDVAEAEKTIAGNKQIQDLAPRILAAVAAIKETDEKLAQTTAAFSERQAEQRTASDTLRQLEKSLAGLGPIEERLTNASRDAEQLDTVPCGGTGEYAACKFLTNATAAQAQIADLTARLQPKADLADRVGAAARETERLAAAVTALQSDVKALTAQRAEHEKLAKYETPLAQSTARIESLTAAIAKACTDAEQALVEAEARHTARVDALTAQAATLDATLVRLTTERDRAAGDLTANRDDHARALTVQTDLAFARRDWDTVTATLATVESGRAELARRRQELAATRDRLADVRVRLVRVEAEWLEWQDFAKALGKNGLQDLEIDASGVGLSATANALLLHCMGPHYTMELVTQTAKADGSGLKDEFTVKVIDNEAGGDWRDISRFSGGQKTILQEALMCAFSLYVNERSPRPMRTLWRDESGAALDPENAIRYVQMLRKVRELGGFHQVFFISHNPQAAALADAQIRVSGGQAVIVLPPYSEAA